VDAIGADGTLFKKAFSMAQAQVGFYIIATLVQYYSTYITVGLLVI